MLGGDEPSPLVNFIQYDEEMLCFLVQITEFTPNSPWFTHIGAAVGQVLTSIHQIKLTQQPLTLTFLHHNPSRGRAGSIH